MGVATSVLRAAVKQEAGQRVISERTGTYAAAMRVGGARVVSPTRRSQLPTCRKLLGGGACPNVRTWARGCGMNFLTRVWRTESLDSFR